MKCNIDKLNEIAKPMPQKAIDSAKFRKDNREWLTVSLKIAIKIRKILKDKNLKQIDLAERMGVSPQQVNKILSGKENLCIETIAKVAKALDLSFSQITDIERKKVSNDATLVANKVEEVVYTPTPASTVFRSISTQVDKYQVTYDIANFITPNNLTHYIA